MNIKRSATWGLLAGAAACAALAAMPGCELLVDFDRGKIPGADGSVGDDVTEPPPDAPASSDVAAGDGSTPVNEAGPDATPSPDGAVDAGDSSTPPPDTGAPDTGTDAPPDTGTVVDSGPDAASDSGDGG